MPSKKSRFIADSKVAQMITEALNDTDITQSEVAEEMGFDRPNILTMYKQARTRMPITRAKAFCRATGYDYEKLLDAMIQEYYPEIYESLGDLRGEALLDTERSLIRIIRNAMDEAREETRKKMAGEATDEKQRIAALRHEPVIDTSPEALRKLRNYILKNMVA